MHAFQYLDRRSTSISINRIVLISFKKTLSISLLLLLMLAGTGVFNSVTAQIHPSTGRIVVKVIAFRSSQGSIQLSLYDKSQSNQFPKIDVRKAMARVPVTNSSVTEVVFDNVPFGTYAIAGLHDENDSGDMDYNFIGLPKEGYCFSNDAKPVLSPPAFDKAQFRLSEKQKVLYIAMQY